MKKKRTRLPQRNPKDFAKVLKSLFDTHRRKTGETMADLASVVAPDDPDHERAHLFLRRASTAGVKSIHKGNRQKLNAVLAHLFRIPGKTSWTDAELFETTATKIVEEYVSARAAYDERRGKLERIKTHEPRLYWTLALLYGEEETDEYVHQALHEDRKTLLDEMRNDAANCTVVYVEPWPDDPAAWFARFEEKYPDESLQYVTINERPVAIEKMAKMLAKAKTLGLAFNDAFAADIREKMLLAIKRNS